MRASQLDLGEPKSSDGVLLESWTRCVGQLANNLDARGRWTMSISAPRGRIG